MNDSLKLYVQKIKNLPTLPIIAEEVLCLVGDDLISLDKLEKVVQNDPVISAKILSVANSVFFGLKVRSKTLDGAIMRIGFNNVKNIALGISLMTVLEDGKGARKIDYKRIYNHSVSVGFSAGLISRELKLDFSEEILINGMLHDIGYLVLNKYFPEIYQKLLDSFEKEKSFLEMEKTVLDFTHADIGTWLVEKWNLPNTILDTTLYHHTPSLAKKNLKRIAVIHIADYIVAMDIMGATEKDPGYPFDPASLEILGISGEDLNDIEAKICGDINSDQMFR
ncbi:MAG TPA: HDOD domain-containing protein [Nitrospirae bacterium]|nr:HDOD domain-containing protein [Nitrospirota bacterium]